jgi:hypothetical protein
MDKPTTTTYNPKQPPKTNSHTGSKCRVRSLDLKNQLFADDNEHPQRFFTEKEIPTLFSRFNVEIQTLKRFYYPWSICKEFDWGYVEGHDSVIYDYFIVGRKLK